MIRSILADKVNDDILLLESMLSEDFPDIQVCAKANNISSTSSFIYEFNPELAFISLNILVNCGIEVCNYFTSVNCEIIFLSYTDDYVDDVINCKPCGYLLKPVQKSQMSVAVNNALTKISMKQENARNRTVAEKYFKISSNKDVIGIPTIEGFEFVPISDIIRCEGLRKCTLVIIRDRIDLISSYNIGEFRKILESYGFYSPHKSHLINLNHIRKYYKEGNILMTNNSYVPVAKRKKREFLNHVKHI